MPDAPARAPARAPSAERAPETLETSPAAEQLEQLRQILSGQVGKNPWEIHGNSMGKWRFHCGNLWMWKHFKLENRWRMRMGMVFLDGIFFGFFRGEN